MNTSLIDFVDALPILDVHEHHFPEVLLARDVGLLDLLRGSYAGWARARPYPLPSETRAEDPMLARQAEGSWDDVAAFVQESGSNHFVRNMVRALSDLYELGEGEITRNNWQALDGEIRRRHADPEWPGRVLDKARVAGIITDAYTDPLLDARAALGQRYWSVCRINALALAWHPQSRDHNGNSAAALADRLSLPLDTFDDLLALVDRLVETLAERHQVAIKNALAYDRDLCFDEPDERLARAAWGKREPTAAERKALGDFVVDRICRVAGAHDVPVQMHLGTGLIRGSHPMNVAGLIERHPRTRFLLMHLAYPWSGDLLALAFVYRNVWLDLTWSLLLSPSHFRRALHEAIEVLPDESRMMLGGDNWHAEESYGTLSLARRLIGAVLQEKVRDRYFTHADAERLARKILHRNATTFFGLPPVE